MQNNVAIIDNITANTQYCNAASRLHLIRQPFGLPPSPQGEGFEWNPFVGCGLLDAPPKIGTIFGFSARKYIDYLQQCDFALQNHRRVRDAAPYEYHMSNCLEECKMKKLHKHHAVIMSMKSKKLLLCLIHLINQKI